MDFVNLIAKSVHMSGEQTTFLSVFGGGLDPNNRWLKLGRMLPWPVIDEEYEQHFDPSRGGQKPLPARVAFGSLLIQQRLSLTDEETVAMIQENPYLQAFLGFAVFSHERPFDPSLMVHFRRRFDVDFLQNINELIVAEHLAVAAAAEDNCGDDDTAPPSMGCTSSDDAGDREPPQPRGTLMMDATCAPADITYPTDLGLLNHAREVTERIIDHLHQPHRGVHRKPRTYRNIARKQYLRIAKRKKIGRQLAKKGCRQQLRFVRRNLAHIDTRLATGHWDLRALPAQLYGKLLVIRHVVKQQHLLNVANQPRVDDRIVSIDQPHVRCLPRGKAKAEFEFGAKIAVVHDHGFALLERLNWDPYNEKADLILHAENYHRRHGTYPRRILADKIYRTKKNREWCKENGIRLAGLGPGRPPSDPEKIRQRIKESRQDEADRQPIEGIFGRAKRRFSLGRLLTRRADTSATSIALIMIVMNLERILKLFCGFIFQGQLRHQAKTHALLDIITHLTNGLCKIAQVWLTHHTKIMGRLVVQ